MTEYRNQILQGDVIDRLKDLPNESVNCVVTSPPYWGLRDYGMDGQIGREDTPQEFIDRLTVVFEEVRRVLHRDGTLWLNLGDTYAANRKYQVVDNKHCDVGNGHAMRVPDGLKAKDLIGIPWRVALSLQAAGWYLRSDIIWSKPNPMPESCTDRPTKAHEYIFLLSKTPKYFYDHEAVKEAAVYAGSGRTSKPRGGFGGKWKDVKGKEAFRAIKELRNLRTVWDIPTNPYKEAHFATFPPALVEPCIKAGCPVGGIVLDPFFGSGTTGMVAKQLGRDFVGIELNPEYVAIAKRRLNGSVPLLMVG